MSTATCCHCGGKPMFLNGRTCRTCEECYATVQNRYLDRPCGNPAGECPHKVPGATLEAWRLASRRSG